MALALNSSHALASAVTALIAVDGNTGSLVDLKTARTFTVDAGVTFVDDATNGKVLRTAGADASSAKGFSFAPAVTMATQVAGFGSTIFLVLAKHAGDDGGLPRRPRRGDRGGHRRSRQSVRHRWIGRRRADELDHRQDRPGLRVPRGGRILPAA